MRIVELPTEACPVSLPNFIPWSDCAPTHVELIEWMYAVRDWGFEHETIFTLAALERFLTEWWDTESVEYTKMCDDLRGYVECEGERELPGQAALEILQRDLAELSQQIRQRDPAKEWFTVEEAAVEMGLAEWTVRRKCAQGKLSPIRKLADIGRWGKGEWRINREAIEKYKNFGASTQAQ